MDKERFLEIRMDLGLTQTKLGKLLGVSRKAIYRFEKGEWPVSKVVRDKLISHLNKLKKEK